MFVSNIVGRTTTYKDSNLGNRTYFYLFQCDQIWRKFANFDKIVKVFEEIFVCLFCIWQVATYWIFFKKNTVGQNFSFVNSQILKIISSHLVTLLILDLGSGQKMEVLHLGFAYHLSKKLVGFLASKFC